MKNIFSSYPIADIGRHYGLTYFDIGSRGGFQDDLYPIAFAVDVVGFEPDPEEFERLLRLPIEPWRSITHLPYGVGNISGRQKLFIPTDPQSASLLKHNTKIGRKFNKTQFFEIERTEEIETLCLQDALEKTALKSIDYLKIDIEGAELAVFMSSPAVISNVLAIKTEVSFLPFRNSQPLARDIDLFLGKAGFELMDITEPAHWRRHGHLIHPYYSSENPPYSKAQIMQADCLYFRDPDTLGGDVAKLLKLSLIALSFGYFDHALMILERPEIAKFLSIEFGKSPIDIVGPSSRTYGRKAFLRAFYLQIRNIVPFVRYLKNLLRR
jgi:FkbM family methyltransferase